ncbi:sialidase family protein [uncultured Salegentibacter sp.]|uniref:sialidase family protein n=1 Tax=uncultured Salegentibacter sp. TaxID=259320 RepID=UPI0025952435|nr:sialidase family protein [uncultured Salegentibacter sp.]
MGSSSDWADMDLLLRRSIDGGRTWEPIKIIAKRRKGEPTSNATPIVDRNGTIHLLFQRDYANAYYTRSVDDGVTWSEPKDLTYAFETFRPEYDWKVLAPGPGHSIQLKSGRLLVPVWLSDPEKTEPKRGHRPSVIGTIYSDNSGETWHRGDIVVNDPSILKNPSETMAVQLEDGRVMLNIRNESEEQRRAVSYSPNGISDWTEISFDEELFEPVCMASIIRHPGGEGSKELLLFSNPDSRDLPDHPRKNLTLKVSRDEGKSWSHQKVLDSGTSGYSDLAVGPNGLIYCLYETNTVKEGWNYSLVLKKFNKEWLFNEDPQP